MTESFKGVFAALTTPFIQDEISHEEFIGNIQKFNSLDLAGYVVLGSTGEAVYLTDEESEKMVQAAKENTPSDKKILVGTARESTKITLEFTNHMASLGADAALIRTPSYFKSRIGHEALKKHYLTIADHSKIPVIIYNIPQYTGISIDPRLIIELSGHPNIAGIKDSSGNLAFLGEVILHLDPNFNFLLGAGSLFLPGLILGACGGILRLADVAPAQCIKLYNLFLEKMWDEALKLQLALIPLNNAVTKTYGVPGLKYAMDLLGYYGGLPRSPLLPPDEKDKKEIENILNKLNLINISKE